MDYSKDFRKTVFLYTVTYPKDIDMLNGVPPNTFWEYVGSHYLNSFVNLLEPKKVWLLTRYKKEGHEEAITEIEKGNHPKLCQHDDCILIGQSGSESWVFWFDRDSSDCCIGRSDVSVEEMIKEMEHIISEDYRPFHQIDPKTLMGWLSW